MLPVVKAAGRQRQKAGPWPVAGAALYKLCQGALCLSDMARRGAGSGFAAARNLLVACNDDALGEKSLADIKDVLQHGRSVDGCQQLVGAEAAAYAGRQDDTGYFRIFYVHKVTSRF